MWHRITHCIGRRERADGRDRRKLRSLDASVLDSSWLGNRTGKEVRVSLGCKIRQNPTRETWRRERSLPMLPGGASWLGASLVELSVYQVCSLEFRRETEPVRLSWELFTTTPREVVGVIQVNKSTMSLGGGAVR